MLTPSEWTRAFQWMSRVLSVLMLALCVLPSSGQSPATQANVVTSSILYHSTIGDIHKPATQCDRDCSEWAHAFGQALGGYRG